MRFALALAAVAANATSGLLAALPGARARASLLETPWVAGGLPFWLPVGPQFTLIYSGANPECRE